MKKLTTKILLTAAALSAAAVMPAQTAAPAPAAVPAVAPAAKPAPSVEQLLAFLPDVVAESGSIKVTKAEIIGRLKDMQDAAGILAQMPENIRMIQLRRIAENIVNEKLYLAMAEKAGFKADKVWAKAQLLKNFSELPPEQQEAVKKQLEADKMTLDQFINKSLENATQIQYIAIGSYMDSLFKQALAKITDADVKKFYEDNKEKEFKQPETARVAHILVMPVDNPQELMKATPEQWSAAEKKIKEAQDRLNKGEDFGAVAAAVSACPSGKQSKGELPAFTSTGQFLTGQGGMDPDFTKASFALVKAGDVSAPVKTMFGYHIIKLLEKSPAGYIPLDANMTQQIKQYLAQQEVGKELDAVRAANPVKVFGLEVKAPDVPVAPVAK